MRIIVHRKIITVSRPWLIILFALSGAAFFTPSCPASARRFTIDDAIQRETMLLPDGNPPSSETAGNSKAVLWSPDGKHFLLRTRRGELSEDLVDERLWLFNVKDVRRAAEGASSATNIGVMIGDIRVKDDDGAITALQWISNSSVGFIAPDTKGMRQAFSVDIGTRTVTQLTHSQTDVRTFALRLEHLYYLASAAGTEASVDPARDGLLSVLVGQQRETTPVHLYHQNLATGGVTKLTEMPFLLYPWFLRIWPSPDGRRAILLIPIVNVPSYWNDYTFGRGRRPLLNASRAVDPASLNVAGLPRLALADLDSKEVSPLMDAPSGRLSSGRNEERVAWAPNSSAVLVANTYLPRAATVHRQAKQNESQLGCVRINLPARDVHTIRCTFNPQIDRSAEDDGEQSKGRIDVRIVEGLNCPPRLYVFGRSDAKGHLIYDPNPNWKGIQFGLAQEVRWTDRNGVAWRGALILPPNYVAGHRYPLIVQTHGFVADEFLIDGPSGITTAFSAQGLAAAGFAVLQIEDSNRAFTADTHESLFFAEGYRAGIQQVLDRGIAAKGQVGLIAFSRTGLHAIQLLARFPDTVQALVTSDAPWWGYMQNRMLFPSAVSVEYDASTLGLGHAETLVEAASLDPLYDAVKSDAAIRIEANGESSLVAYWELYSLLKNAGRPVELLYQPDASHVVMKPSFRLLSQGGTVDWFRLWLQGAKEPTYVSSEQYAKWAADRERWLSQ